MIFITSEKLKQIPPKNPNVLVKVTESGNVIDILYMTNRNNKQTIQMLEGGNQYVVCSTGEVKDIEHHYKTRLESKHNLYKTFSKIRGIINANVINPNYVRWCTLTYAENMQDPNRLRSDFEKFHKRFLYYCMKKGFSKPEYICVMEPQARGAWHAHLLYIWQDMVAPFIPNSDFAELWTHGFVKIKKLKDIDNVGAYLTAYLGDMELSEVQNMTVQELLTIENCKVVNTEFVDENGKKVSKAIIKGARLNLYPAKFNMYRCSQGIKRPVEEYMSQKMAQKKVSGATKTFESATEITDNDFKSTIIREQYNKAKVKKQ